MDVLHVHSGNMFGGVERMLETLAPATAGVTPMRSSYALCFDGRVAAGLVAAGAEIHPLGPVHARRPHEVRRARRALRTVLGARSWAAAFVHSAWSQALFGPVIRASGVPLVRWLHAPQPGPKWLEYWSERAHPALVLCNSHYTLSEARGRVSAERVVVQYPPAVLQRSEAVDRQQVRDEVGTPAGSVVITVAARMEAWKGHQDLLACLPLLQRGDWTVWIVGEAQHPAERSYLSALRDQVSGAGLDGRVRFLGFRPDVHRVLRASDIYCQPNRSPEPFGLAFVEALAAGLPVVTTRTGAAPEIVDDSCGVLLDDGSPAALAAALQTLVDDRDLRQRRQEASLERARLFLNLPRAVARLAAEVESLAVPSPSLS